MVLQKLIDLADACVLEIESARQAETDRRFCYHFASAASAASLVKSDQLTSVMYSAQ